MPVPGNSTGDSDVQRILQISTSATAVLLGANFALGETIVGFVEGPADSKQAVYDMYAPTFLTTGEVSHIPFVTETTLDQVSGLNSVYGLVLATDPDLNDILRLAVGRVYVQVDDGNGASLMGLVDVGYDSTFAGGMLAVDNILFNGDDIVQNSSNRQDPADVLTVLAFEYHIEPGDMVRYTAASPFQIDFGSSPNDQFGNGFDAPGVTLSVNTVAVPEPTFGGLFGLGALALRRRR